MKMNQEIRFHYRCPRCGGEDFNAEVPAIMQMDGGGGVEVVDSDHYVDHVHELSPVAYAAVTVVCGSEDCEYSGKLPEFEAGQITITRSFDGMAERYRWDRGPWLQVDTKQDAPYFGTWIDPDRREIVSFAEGDITVTTCDTDKGFAIEVRRMADWHKTNGYWLGIDPGWQPEKPKARLAELGLDDLTH